MATIFPGSASVNQEFNGYVYNGVAWDIITPNLNDVYTDQTLSVIPAKTNDYTLASGDQGDLIQASGTFTISIPTDATFNFVTGTQINIINIGTGIITLAAASPGTTTVNGTPGLKTRAQWSLITAIKLSGNNWVIVGDTAA
jgi:hypothetical protein